MIYRPREDSYLLTECIKDYISSLDNKDIKVLDMGSGSGVQATTCFSAGIKKQNILAVDIDEEVITHLKNKGIEVKNSNLFSNIKEKFDLILFNPPYLPEDKYDNGLDTTAGKEGYEIITEFLRQAKRHLTKQGKILLLISSFSKPKIIKKELKDLNLDYKKLRSKNMGFFERIEVWNVWQS